MASEEQTYTMPHEARIAAAMRAGTLQKLILNVASDLEAALPQQIPSNARSGEGMDALDRDIIKKIIMGQSVAKTAELVGSSEGTVLRRIGEVRKATGARINPHLPRRLFDLGILRRHELPTPEISDTDLAILGLHSYGVKTTEVGTLTGLHQGSISRRMKNIFEAVILPKGTYDATFAVLLGFHRGLLKAESAGLPPQYPLPPVEFVLRGMERILYGKR